MNEEYDVIDIEGEEYVIVEEFQIEDNQYALICPLLENDIPSEDAVVVKMEEDRIIEIEDEHEKNLIKDYLEGRIQALENNE